MNENCHDGFSEIFIDEIMSFKLTSVKNMEMYFQYFTR